ncbi:hypothetical protein GOP47_0027663 [Adiantum capillus-veneris]|nr:hypothetical protein GOP47_0027663 [Adiantum capillus-veneris]
MGMSSSSTNSDDYHDNVHVERKRENVHADDDGGEYRVELAGGAGAGSGRYVRYTREQVQALEKVYCDCPKPSLVQRQQLIRDCSLLHSIDPKQIKVWFQNRRCREKQRKEWTRLQSLNGKLTAINTLLMEENVQLQQHVAHLLSLNHSLSRQLASSPTSPPS